MINKFIIRYHTLTFKIIRLFLIILRFVSIDLSHLLLPYFFCLPLFSPRSIRKALSLINSLINILIYLFLFYKG